MLAAAKVASVSNSIVIFFETLGRISRGYGVLLGRDENV